MADVKLLVDAKNLAGESPVWDSVEQRLYWTDTPAGELWSCREDGSDVRRWYIPCAIGSFALRTAGGAVLAMADGFSLYDFESRRFTPIGDPEASEPGNMLNDCKVDRRGRLLAGYMSYDYEPNDITTSRAPLRNSSLYRLDPDLSIHKLDSGFICSNGPCWSPDDRTFYLSDSYDKKMYAYDYDIAAGTITNRRVFLSNEAYAGTFDGATVDTEGFIWSAHVFGGRIIRYAPDGRIDRSIDMPVRFVTSVMFGGRNLDVLYATSMGQTVGGKPMREPAAGGLFAIRDVGARGLPEPRFGG